MSTRHHLGWLYSVENGKGMRDTWSVRITHGPGFPPVKLERDIERSFRADPTAAIDFIKAHFGYAIKLEETLGARLGYRIVPATEVLS